MRKFALLAFFLLALAGTAAAYNSVIAPSGQTIYYYISGGNAILRPPFSMSSGGWNGFTRPVGNLVIPDSITDGGTAYPVTALSPYAFSGCSDLTGVSIPATVTTMGNSAFIGCSGLTRVDFRGTIAQWCGISFSMANGNTSNPLSFAHRFYIDSAEVVDLVIPSSVTHIGGNAFYRCYSLRSVSIPSPVTYIGKSAFEHCDSLLSVVIGDAVDTVGESAFWLCSRLESLVIGRSVAFIGRHAFGGDTNATVTSRAVTAPLLDSPWPFTYFPSTYPIHIPCGSTPSYDSAWSPLANFIEAPIPTVYASSIDNIMGSVSVFSQPDSCTDTVTVAASASPGYLFAHWSDGATANPYLMNVVCDTHVVAYFAILRQDTVAVHDTVWVTDTIVLRDTVWAHDTAIVHDTVIESLTYRTLALLSADTALGIVAGSGRFPEGTVVEIAAIPIQCSRFVEWDDGCTENPRSVTLASDAAYTALFESDDADIAPVAPCPFRVSVDNSCIVVTGAAGRTIRIYDTAGRLLAVRKNASHAQKFAMSANGVYLVQVDSHPAQRAVVAR